MNAIPRRVARYQIVRELGWGAAGRVFLAQDPTVDRQVALKVMAPRAALSPAEDAEMRERFLLEARAAGRLRHPNVVLVWDAGVDRVSGQPYLAMEYVDGLSLDQLLTATKPLTPELVAAIGIQVARGLDHAHREGVVHRDVKPANILLAHDGNAKVGDFGIARVEGLELTGTGMVLGSPLYMSPEQVRAEPLDGRSDIFSLAAVLFEAATGVARFAGPNLASITWHIAWGEGSPSVAETIPEALRKVLQRALLRDPGARHQNGAAFAADLAAAVALPPGDREGRELLAGIIAANVAGLPTSLESAPTTFLQAPSRRRNHHKLFGAAAVVGLALLGGWGMLAIRDPAPPPGSTLAPGGAPEAVAATTPAVAEPPAPADAYLEVLLRLRLRAARLAVWVDGERVHHEAIRGPNNILNRPFGRDVEVRLPLAPGQRTLEFRVAGDSMKVDANTVLVANFTPATTRRLRLTLNPYNDRLDWRWEEKD